MLQAFESLLARHIGLDVESVGRELIARAVHERQKSSGASDLDAYWEVITRSPAELQALVEAVVVLETWFFRDREAFASLAQEARGAWLSSHASGPLRILSLPCATGEEPYSIAMALLGAGVPAARLAIEGVDISEQALGRARRGLYGKNAFRGKELAFRDRYFDAVEGGFQLRDECRAVVSFRSGNLLDADITLGAGQYHAVFCRNVLIYLDSNAQRRALEVLTRLLNPDGLLFVGPSETSLLRRGFSPLRVPLAFAFRKGPVRSGERARASLSGRAKPRQPEPRAPHRADIGPAPPSTAQNDRLRAVPTLPTAARVGATDTTPRAAERPAAPGKPTSAIDADAHLELVASLADRGQLKEAYRLCTEHERLHGASARLFYLMGLLREADDQLEEAATFHKKALYLDPLHEEALTHLALLLEKQGDTAGAERLRQRARRSGPKEGA